VQDSVIQWVSEKFYERPLQPHELQRARKIVYGVLILVLFTSAFFWRRFVVEAQADQLALREQSLGDVELSGSLMRLTLTGSRGVATCVLWSTAIDKQKKNQWNELEFYVNALTKLQPHFTTPWLFQSWNLSYNVAAESDRWTDKYFYITRGIQLLYRGERQNRNNPDMRLAVGFYTEHKICQSDETHVHRSLFQLSCIPLNERDPARFRTIDSNGKESFNWKEFDDFCRKHPQLVRRLRAGIRREGGTNDRVAQRLIDSQFRCNSVEEVVNFLADNWRLPGLYQDAPETLPGQNWDRNRQDLPRPLVERFPALPPPRIPSAPQRSYEPYPGFKELTTDEKVDGDGFITPLSDDVDGWAVARAWFGYAQEPIPDPDPMLPGETQLVRDRVLQRIPKNMMTVLFRTQPALAQTHQAERLMQEGWFDNEPWAIETWYDSRRKQFEAVGSETSPSPARISVQRNAREAWEDSYRTWEKVGNDNHLRFLDAAEEITIQTRARDYYDRHDLSYGSRPPEPPGGPASLSPQELNGYQAAAVVSRQLSYLRLSNFVHHISRAEIERLEVTMRARNLFFRARRETLNSNFDPALRIYSDDDAIKAWLEKVLLPHPNYRKDDLVQEQTIEFALGYLSVLNEVYGREVCDIAYGLRMIGPFPETCGVGDAAVLYRYLPPKQIPYKGR
jgi:hypothetical protein